MSITASDRRHSMFERAPVGELFDFGPLLLAYAISGVIETAAESLATPAVTVEAALRSGRTLRDLAHDVRRDPEELRLALAHGARSAEIDDRSAAELLAAAGNLLDLPLFVGPP